MHQRVLHILAYASDQVNVVDKQFFEKALRDVSLVGHEFSEDFLRKLLVFQLLLSSKLQNGRKIHLEALLNRTSGFLFQKESPPKN